MAINRLKDLQYEYTTALPVCLNRMVYVDIFPNIVVHELFVLK